MNHSLADAILIAMALTVGLANNVNPNENYISPLDYHCNATESIGTIKFWSPHKKGLTFGSSQTDNGFWRAFCSFKSRIGDLGNTLLCGFSCRGCRYYAFILWVQLHSKGAETYWLRYSDHDLVYFIANFATIWWIALWEGIIFRLSFLHPF